MKIDVRLYSVSVIGAYLPFFDGVKKINRDLSVAFFRLGIYASRRCFRKTLAGLRIRKSASPIAPDLIRRSKAIYGIGGAAFLLHKFAQIRTIAYAGGLSCDCAAGMPHLLQMHKFMSCAV